MISQRTIRARAVYSGLLVFPLILLCACSGPSNASASGGTNTTATSTATTGAQITLPAILPLLQKSLQAMQQVQTMQVALQGKGTIQTEGPFLPAFAQETGYSLRGKAAIDIARQEGQLQARLMLKLPQAVAISFKVAARFSGSKLYLQAPTRQWFVLDSAGVAALLKASTAGLAAQPQDLVALLASVKITDHGMTTIAGTPVRHITLSSDKHTPGQLASTVKPPQVRQILASVHITQDVSVDLFIDEATSRLVRLEVKGGVQVDVNALLAAIGQPPMPSSAGHQTPTLTVTFALTLTLGKFNQPVPKLSIPPGSATPIALIPF